jgi:pSer/pThr/pTyr-binding forkhead associated (FHA) protein
MVAAKVILTCTAGTHSGREYVIDEPTRCVVGRAPDCSIQLAGGLEDWLVSRHHCEVDVQPPSVLVHDLGSRNGTFVNGERIVGTGREVGAEKGEKTIPREYELRDGDELRVGPVPFRVSIKNDATA